MPASVRPVDGAAAWAIPVLRYVRTSRSAPQVAHEPARVVSLLSAPPSTRFSPSIPLGHLDSGVALGRAVRTTSAVSPPARAIYRSVDCRNKPASTRARTSAPAAPPVRRRLMRVVRALFPMENSSSVRGRPAAEPDGRPCAENSLAGPRFDQRASQLEMFIRQQVLARAWSRHLGEDFRGDLALSSRRDSYERRWRPTPARPHSGPTTSGNKRLYSSCSISNRSLRINTGVATAAPVAAFPERSREAQYRINLPKRPRTVPFQLPCLIHISVGRSG